MQGVLQSIQNQSQFLFFLSKVLDMIKLLASKSESYFIILLIFALKAFYDSCP
jgi:hypothetical protein